MRYREIMCEASDPADVLISEMQNADQAVSLDLRKLSDTLVSIEQIWSEETRGVGLARRVMQTLVTRADALGVTLKLVVHWLAYDPHDDDPDYDRLHDLNLQKLTNDQLEAWYRRLGFVRTGQFQGDDPVMVRHATTGLREDLNHSQRLLFHTTGVLGASMILATGVIAARTDDKAYAASSGNGVSLTRSYEYALRHRGRQRDKIIFVLTGLNTRPVDYWADKASRRTEAEEWHVGQIDLRQHLVSINSPALSLAEFVGRVGETMKGLDQEQAAMLYRGQIDLVKAWHKRGYRQDARFWNRWQPVRGMVKEAVAD